MSSLRSSEPSALPARTAVSALGAGAVALLALVLLARCYEAPTMRGPYRCLDDLSCGDTGLVCDDGICCDPTGGEPTCPSFVLDGGMCPDGGTAALLYEDLDHDHFGNENAPKLYCRMPLSDSYVPDGGDCNDNPAAGGELFFPGAQEQCDGLDNDCDGVVDEGLVQRPYYKDQDNDGFGDPNRRLDACARPPGYVEDSSDCGGSNAAVHPGAPEVCNGIDDNCNGLKDDIPDAGVACTDRSRLGICQAGVIACQGTSVICKQTVTPAALDICNGQDDNCNGQTDERPDCGGPVRLDIDPDTDFEVKRLTTHYDSATPLPSSCLRDYPEYIGTADTLDLANMIWQGTGFQTHVFSSINRTGYWDLSRTGASLRVRFWYSITSSASPIWGPYNQPLVQICGPAGFVRLSNAGLIGLSSSGSGSTPVDSAMPLRGGNGWTIDARVGQLDAILRQVKHVELVVQPQSSSPAAVFRVDMSTYWGFP